jgi:Acyclic terpene utilisation family protein AtuA
MTRQSVRIGNGCGFWGDNLDAPILLAQQGRLDYLTLDYLAELTMSILALQKQRDPQAGFATDFLDVLERLTPLLRDQPSLKIVTNAGGMNPIGCVTKAKEILKKAGLDNRRVATVTGDDLFPRLDELMSQGHALANMDTGEPLSSVWSRVVSANAYLGAKPIADALKLGASVVITGRVADASLTVGPAAHEFGWAWDDWDRLSAGTVAGHLIECGAQVTGGLWCNWQEAPDLANVGYPIVEIEPSGLFRVTKPPNTGGRVNHETVAEQLLYEVGDPAAYLTPDVNADFTSVSLAEKETDVVEVSAARGRPATDWYKVSIAYRDGFMASGTLVVFGSDANIKALRCGEIILDRVKRAGWNLEHTNIERLGAGDCMPGVHPQIDATPEAVSAERNRPVTSRMSLHEVVLRVSARDSRKGAVERFTKEFAPLVTSGPPGITGYTTGRPAVREVFAYWPALVDKKAMSPKVQLH